MFWLPFKAVGGKIRLTTNCSGAVATAALTVVIFGTLLILKFAAPLPGPHKGRVREYFIAAEPVLWDYTPLSHDPMTGASWNGSIIANAKRDGAPMVPANLYYLDQDLELAVQAGPERIGTRYSKVRYVEYATAAFDVRKTRPADERHLGLLGPLIRAEVGDLIRVHFLNRCPFAASMHPHALFYLREDEGVPMNVTPHHSAARAARQLVDHGGHDGGHTGGSGLNMPPISPGRGDGSAVKPGDLHVYEWQVPERAGPSGRDGSSVAWPYHSHVDETADPNAGLVGAILITREGAARGRDDPRPADVDRELVLYLALLDENVSPLLNDSMGNATAGMNATELQALLDDPFWRESNIKHTVNGYLYNNLPDLTVYSNETVRWHVLGLGDEKDLHGVHWHGATLLRRGRRVDSVELIPGASVSADMRPDVAGEWMVHCHTAHHFKRGMSAMYRVVSPCATAADPNAPCAPAR